MYVVQPLTDYDLLRIREIFIATFPRTDDADFEIAWRTKECNYSLGLYHKAKLVGFAITCLADSTAVPKRNNNDICKELDIAESAAAAPADAATVARLWFIAVDPAQRSAGAGSQLLTAVMNAVLHDSMRLLLTPDNNERVINWYKKHGFIVTKRMPFIHKDIPTCWMELIDQSESASNISTETCSSYSISNSNRTSFDSEETLEI